jgi:hypothetical protein
MDAQLNKVGHLFFAFEGHVSDPRDVVQMPQHDKDESPPAFVLVRPLTLLSDAVGLSLSGV